MKKMKKQHLLLASLCLMISLNSFSQKLDELLNVKYKAVFAILSSSTLLK